MNKENLTWVFGQIWTTVKGELYEFAALFEAVFSFRTLTTASRVGANLSILTHIIMTQKCMTRQKYPNSQSEHLERLISKDFQKISHKTNQLSEFAPKIFSLFPDSFLPNEIF